MHSDMPEAGCYKCNVEEQARVKQAERDRRDTEAQWVGGPHDGESLTVLRGQQDIMVAADASPVASWIIGSPSVDVLPVRKVLMPIERRGDGRLIVVWRDA